MIVTARDDRNIIAAADLLQVKMIVAVLRQLAAFPNCRRVLIDASEELHKAGFIVGYDDVLAAISQYSSVMGYRTDQMVHPSKLAQQPPATNTPTDDPPTPKEIVN